VHCAGLTSEALLIISSTDGISCGRLAFLDLRIGRGLRKITSTAVLIRRFRRIMCRCWYSLSWQHAADRASAADSLAHCCRPVSAVSALLSPRVSSVSTAVAPCRETRLPIPSLPCCVTHNYASAALSPSGGMTSRVVSGVHHCVDCSIRP